MHGFSYLAFIIRPKLKEKYQILDIEPIEFRNLTLQKMILNLNYLNILENQGIQLNDIINASEASNLKIQQENSKKPLIYSFVKGESSLLIAVTNYYHEKIKELLQKTVDDFDILFNDIILELENEEVNSFNMNITKYRRHIEEILAKNLSEYILPGFLVPEKYYDSKDEKIQEILQSEEDQYLYNQINSTWAIDEHPEVLELKFWKVREKFFYFWMKNLLYFRMKYYSWDKFRQTVKVPLFLKKGSKENIELVQRFNTHKIIKIIQFIGEEATYQEIIQKFNITRTKINKFLTTLLHEEIIRKVPLIPKIDHVSEDLIPLLTMQGFSKEDFNILHKLEKHLNGKKTLEEVSLELTIPPSRVKSLLDRYKNAIKVLI